jgi:hypothetical protein
MHWYLGMYASGSTWLFNAAAKVAATLKPDIPVVTRYVTCATDLQSTSLDQHTILITTHDTDDAAAAALRDSARVVLMSVREPRDCVTSLMLYQRDRFSLALATVESSARACVPLAKDKRTTLLRYEAGFIDDPRTLDRLAAGFGGTLASPDRSRIFLNTRRSAIELQISRLSSLRMLSATWPRATSSIRSRNGMPITAGVVAKLGSEIVRL